jgi:hypothetical protein
MTETLKHISNEQLTQHLQERVKGELITPKQILKDFETEAIHRELLGRLKCEFNRPGCTKTAEDYIIKPFNYQQDPACLPCKWKVIEEVEESIKAKKLKVLGKK